MQTASSAAPGGNVQPSATEAQRVTLPALHSIHKATVASVTQFGRFVEIPGFPKAGLLHATQTEGEPERGQAVFVKVVSVDEAQGRFGLTNRFIDASTGADLDPEGRQRATSRTDMPAQFSVHRGRVSGIKPFGCFVDLEGGAGRGMVHVSHLAAFHVDKVDDVVREGDLVWVKVVGTELDDAGRAKVALSMKAVDQESGRDLDPSNVEAELDARRRPGGRGGVADQLPPARGDLVHGDAIKLIYNPTNDVMFGGGRDGKKYELITDVPAGGTAMAGDGRDDDAARRERKRRRKEEKKARKADKKAAKKAKKAAKKAKKKAKKKAETKERKHKRARSASASSSSSSESS